MVDGGNPMTSGTEVTQEAVTPIEQGPESFTGYSIIRAESRDAALDLAASNPMPPPALSCTNLQRCSRRARAAPG